MKARIVLPFILAAFGCATAKPAKQAPAPPTPSPAPTAQTGKNPSKEEAEAFIKNLIEQMQKADAGEQGGGKCLEHLTAEAPNGYWHEDGWAPAPGKTVPVCPLVVGVSPEGQPEIHLAEFIAQTADGATQTTPADLAAMLAAKVKRENPKVTVGPIEPKDDPNRAGFFLDIPPGKTSQPFRSRIVVLRVNGVKPMVVVKARWFLIVDREIAPGVESLINNLGVTKVE